MAISSTSIADIEQQIAKVNAQLQEARAKQFATAEKAYLAAQKAAEQARTKVRDLVAKGTGTVAAQNRLLTAQANAEDLDIKLGSALDVYDALKEQQKASEKFAKKVGKVLAGKSLGKKIKFTREEKDVLKEDKKIAKKAAKADKKAEKNKATEATEEQLSTVALTEESKPVVKKAAVKKAATNEAAAKKAVTKKAPAKKAVPDVKEDAPTASQAPAQEEIKETTSAETTSVETSTAHDALVESNVEAVTESESAPVDLGIENPNQDLDKQA